MWEPVRSQVGIRLYAKSFRLIEKWLTLLIVLSDYISILPLIACWSRGLFEVWRRQADSSQSEGNGMDLRTFLHKWAFRNSLTTLIWIVLGVVLSILLRAPSVRTVKCVAKWSSLFFCWCRFFFIHRTFPVEATTTTTTTILRMQFHLWLRTILRSTSILRYGAVREFTWTWNRF